VTDKHLKLKAAGDSARTSPRWLWQEWLNSLYRKHIIAASKLSGIGEYSIIVVWLEAANQMLEIGA